jgi:hypothetical protein
MAKRKGGLCGNSLNINLEIKSVSRRYAAINRCILRRDELVLALQSNAVANFSKPTVCTLHSVLIIKTKNLTRARFQPDCSWKYPVMLLQAVWNKKFTLLHSRKRIGVKKSVGLSPQLVWDEKVCFLVCR